MSQRNPYTAPKATDHAPDCPLPNHGPLIAIGGILLGSAAITDNVTSVPSVRPVVYVTEMVMLASAIGCFVVAFRRWRGHQRFCETERTGADSDV